MQVSVTIFLCSTTLSLSSQDSTSPAPALPSPKLSHGKKTGQPSKLVDLGAAATYASQAVSSQPSESKPQAGTGGADPLFDIFGGFSSATAPAGQTQLQQPVSTQGQFATWIVWSIRPDLSGSWGEVGWGGRSKR